MIEIPASHRDLLNSPVAVLATNGKDGFPQVTALWFLFDDDGVAKTALNTKRQKVKNLQQNPQCTLFIIDPASPYRTIEIRAQAQIEADPDYVFSDKLGAKYNSDLRAMDGPEDSRVVVSFNPIKINTWG